MSRCLVLAAALWDPHRSPMRVEHHSDGSFTQSWQLTAGEIARARRVLGDHRDAVLSLFDAN